MSIATVVSMGYGSFGSVNLLPTVGYSQGEQAIATPGLQATIPPSRLHARTPDAKLHARAKEDDGPS